jgi:hypothetical protein
MLMHRALTAFTLALVAAACSDGIGPRPAAAPQPQYDMTVSSPGTHILRQSPTAPRLQTYRVSFWAKRGTQTTIFVNYRRALGQWLPDPFLRFKIPINGLVGGAGGARLDRGDSVQITMLIDSVSFNVVFQPSGVVFSKSSPAQLAIWYQNADPDLDADGDVDADDRALEEQLAIWYRGTKAGAWKQLWSKNNTMQQYVASAINHFSQYAVAW